MKSLFNAALRSTTGFIVAATTLILAGCGGGESGALLRSLAPAQTNAIGATPTANVAAPAAAPMVATFTAANPRGSIASYEWDFKDNGPIKTGPTVQHTFAEPGTFEVTLTVRDARGNFNKTSTQLTVIAGNTKCTTAQSDFASKVWPAMSATCTACHVSGGPAGGTNLVLSAGPAAQNFNAVSAFARRNDGLLLSKTVGLPTHTRRRAIRKRQRLAIQGPGGDDPRAQVRVRIELGARIGSRDLLDRGEILGGLQGARTRRPSSSPDATRRRRRKPPSRSAEPPSFARRSVATCRARRSTHSSTTPARRTS